MTDDRPWLPEEAADWFRVSRLTQREIQILECVAEGMGHREIAAKLGARPLTIRAHQRSIRHKLGAVTLANAVAIYLRANVA